MSSLLSFIEKCKMVKKSSNTYSVTQIEFTSVLLLSLLLPKYIYYTSDNIRLEGLTACELELGGNTPVNFGDTSGNNFDGLSKSYGLKKIEILLLETSWHFRCTDKGLFGSLVILKKHCGLIKMAMFMNFGWSIEYK
ncbi:MAG: hypothetical protein EXX96DRAFT_536713 [Benjaminiella poitrasii]|nr:MAG: hypothetical protein EXX96DRAFT_536713 [Benjaminiella poitrasii]